jgi:hypothetical protein
MARVIDPGQPLNQSSPHNLGLLARWQVLPDQNRGTVFFDLGRRYPGSLVSGATWGVRGNRPAGFGSLDLTATDAAAQTGHVFGSLSTFTFTCWIRRVGNSNNSGIWGNWSSATNSTYLIRYSSGGSISAFFNGASQQGGNITGLAIPLLAWTCLAVTYDGSALAGYINGVPTGTPLAASGTVQATAANGVSIGRGPGNSQGNPNSFVDDVRFWGRCLSPSELRELYTQAACGEDSTLNWTRHRFYFDVAGGGGVTATPWPYYQQMQAMAG